MVLRDPHLVVCPDAALALALRLMSEERRSYATSSQANGSSAFSRNATY